MILTLGQFPACIFPLFSLSDVQLSGSSTSKSIAKLTGGTSVSIEVSTAMKWYIFSTPIPASPPGRSASFRIPML